MRTFYHYKERLYLRIDAIKYRWYAQKLLKDSSRYFKKSPKFLMKIREGDYNYEYFNFCYMNNMLSLILYSLYHIVFLKYVSMKKRRMYSMGMVF